MAFSGGSSGLGPAGTSATSSSSPAQKDATTPEAMVEDELRRQYEEELRRDCADLDAQLRKDPLSLQNEALEVQLVQMQDDYIALQEDFRSMRDYYGKKIAEMTAQLEEQTRTLGTSQGHADCLLDLLPFHEDQGQHVDSYWRAQCEKRDDSIRFLTLKLQEYTVPWATYHSSRRTFSADSANGKADRSLGASPPPPSPHGGPALSQSHPSSPTTGVTGPASPVRDVRRTISWDVLDLEALHRELCSKYALQQGSEAELSLQFEAVEANASARSSELEAQRAGGLFGSWMMGFGTSQSSSDAGGGGARDGSALAAAAAALSESASEGDVHNLLEQRLAELESEGERLQYEVTEYETAVGLTERSREFDGEPQWAARCIWRDQLDVRAGQLERISLQFDATKRQLDQANDELQWQATSAEALRMRLADVLRQTQVEQHKIAELREEHRDTQALVEELAEQWQAHAVAAEGEDGRPALPLVVQQAQWLLEALRRQAPSTSKFATAGTDGATKPAAEM